MGTQGALGCVFQAEIQKNRKQVTGFESNDFESDALLRTWGARNSMSFFDAAERGALTLTLSRNDPFDADYLTADGAPLYRICTRKRSTGRGRLDTEVTSVQRVRADPSTASNASASAKPWPYRHRRRISHRRTSSLNTPLDTIDEVADADSISDSHSDLILVATIERRPLSLSPVRLRFSGSEVLANKFLRRERPLSSTRCFLSLTGDLLKWQLSTPTPKLYNSDKARVAKYCRPFLPSKGEFSSKTAVVEIAEGIESDRVLDEIIVTLLLTFLL